MSPSMYFLLSIIKDFLSRIEYKWGGIVNDYSKQNKNVELKELDWFASPY